MTYEINDFDHVGPREVNFVDLYTVIDMSGFDYAQWFEQEKTILQPRLEELGYTNIVWLPGETDSFGPLTRICMAIKDGRMHWFIYG